MGAVAGVGAATLAVLVDGLLLIGSFATVATAGTNDKAPVTELLMAPTLVTFPLLAFVAAPAAFAALVTLVAAAAPPRARVDRHPEPGV